MSIPQEFIHAIQQTNVPEYKYYASTGSTNQVAMEWLENGAIDGAIVFADHQSAGRGRFERRWVTQAGSAIAISMIVIPQRDELQHLSLFSPLAGIALVEVLRDSLHIEAQIKWPNDVLIQRKKTSGILTESIWNGDQLLGLVVGIGINVLPASIPLEDVLQYPATCLQDHSPHPINRYEVLVALLKSFRFWRSQLNSPKFMNQWLKTLAFRGEKVYIKQKDGTDQFYGTLVGLTSSGDLEILTENNQKYTVTAGDVHLRPAGPEK
jgi:BirA family biotin operon repressor/biotin-[acetyl-CoA-carboxylase] ligase